MRFHPFTFPLLKSLLKGSQRSHHLGFTKALLLSALLCTGLSGCFFRGSGSEDRTALTNDSINVPSDLENKETQVKLTVPAGWQSVRNQNRGSTDIYATYEPGELYTSVVSETDPVLAQFDIEDNAAQYRWLIQQELDRFESETRTGLTALDGNSAVQYEMRGIVDGTPVVYLHTTVKGRDKYYQVVGWTTEASYRDNKGTLKTVIDSFKGA